MIIEENVFNEIEINKSKFLTYIYKVKEVNEVFDHLEKLKKEYKDATHICYAYIIDNEIKYNDDNEPTGTAGIPILDVLKKNNLNYVVSFVIRYFGGIKLGSGGLVRAYSTSVQKAIENVEKVEKCEGEELQIELQYSDFEKLKYYCEKNNINVTNIDYTENIVCILEILEGETHKILEDLKQKCIEIKRYRNLNKKFITKKII